MAISGSLLRSRELGTHRSYGCSNLNKTKMNSNMHLLCISLSSNALQQNALNCNFLSTSRVPKNSLSSGRNLFQCQSFLLPSGSYIIPVLKNVTTSVTRSYRALHVSPILLKLTPAVGIIAFAVWGLGPLMRLGRVIFLHKNDISWKKSGTYFVMTSYLQPLLLWIGAILVCRVLDPVILPTEASQAVKQRILNFVRSLSSVMAFAYCLSSLIQQMQTFFMETNDSNDARNMGFQFAGKAVYSAVWVAAVSLFMELLGFSTQKWLTAGGLGTVLLTLAGREIFTNFLSSVMIHATRPFVLNEWIQTKIQGYEVSGTVEHVGWWSPTIIRGDDREAIHIPNHKFTMNVVRNLSQKTHWRIKNYLAISHLDVNKINIIVADMRKVLAKNPLVEQQRLHRRVFLENINPDNQALMILVSCFVKTSHFEEYLCVKEAVMLDLLRVISHHRARLATPIRTVQKIYAEADSESNNPFAETIFSSSRAAANRPLLLIEPSYKINGEDKTKVSTHTTRMNEEKEAKPVMSSNPESKANVKGGSTSPLDGLKADDKMASAATRLNTDSSSNVSETTKSDSRTLNSDSSGPAQNSEKQKLEKDLSNGARKEDMSSSGEPMSNPLITSREPKNEKTETPISQSKQDGEKPIAPPSVSRPSLEDNLLLGVALEGSKRTLPIEEEMTPVSNTELKEMAGLRNGSGSTSIGIDKKEDQIQAVPSTTRSDQIQAVPSATRSDQIDKEK